MSLGVSMNSKQTKRPNPKYRLEFKQDAAKLVNEKGYTHQQAADHLGISLSAIGRWVRAERMPKAAPVTKAAAMNLMGHSELVRLRRENEQFQQCCNDRLNLQPPFLIGYAPRSVGQLPSLTALIGHTDGRQCARP
jgi:transposase